MNAPFSYVIELRDKGQEGGFLLPRRQILPTAQETWIAVKAMAEKAAQNLKGINLKTETKFLSFNYSHAS